LFQSLIEVGFLGLDPGLPNEEHGPKQQQCREEFEGEAGPASVDGRDGLIINLEDREIRRGLI
jgi:hypothetical protein